MYILYAHINMYMLRVNRIHDCPQLYIGLHVPRCWWQSRIPTRESDEG